MQTVTNTGEGTLSFKDDDGKIHVLEAGKDVKCNYKRSMDERLVIEDKKKKVKPDGNN